MAGAGMKEHRTRILQNANTDQRMIKKGFRKDLEFYNY